MSKYQVFEALSGEYLGEVDSLHELHVGDGIAADYGRVFRISSITETGHRVRRIEAIETVNMPWIARLDRPAG